MLDDLSAIQSRIQEIQGKLTSLTPNAPPSQPAPTEQASFADSLAKAQAPPSAPPLPPSAAPLPTITPHGAEPPVATVNGEAVHVPPASLGPLPPMPVTPPPGLTAPAASGASDISSLIETYAAKRGLPPSLVKAVIQVESGGNPRAVSRAGAMGLMQLMPDNVKEAGIHDAFDPEQNISAGTQQLADLLKQFKGDLDLALAGYNAGPGNVRKYGGIPPFAETQNYVRKIKSLMEKG